MRFRDPVHGKTQAIRLVDVYLLGPFMVWAGANAKGLPAWARGALVASGLGTIVYNAQNYLSIQAGE